MFSTAARPSERGFSMIELLVVMLIVSVIGGAVMLGVRNTNAASELRATLAAAATYDDAIRAYRADHNDRLPRMGEASWPLDRVAYGPVDPIIARPTGASDDAGQYLRQVPERVTAGIVELSSGAGTKSHRIEYHVHGSETNATYNLIVFADGRVRCAFGNGTTMVGGKTPDKCER